MLLSVNIFAQNKISKNQAVEDIDYFNNMLLEVHYNPFKFISKEKYFKQVEDIKHTIGDSIDKKEFTFKLYHLSSLIKDAHTSPSLFQSTFKNDLNGKIFFPYFLVRDKNKLYIPISTSQKLKIESGSELISINEFKIENLLKDFEGCFGGNKEYSSEMTTRLLPYLLFIKGIIPPFRIECKSKKIRSYLTIKEGVTFKNALTNTIPSLTKAYDFKIFDNKLGLLRFNSMSEDLNTLDHYIDSCVTLMKNKNINNWAIDIRDNSGGNSILADLLISYFNTNEYALMGKREWRISQQYKNELISQGDTANEYLSKSNGTIWEIGDCAPQKPMFVNNNIFTGKIILITGPFTFSSANMFADGVKKYKLGKIYGTNTGENTNDFGEVYSFDLPNSKLRMQTTTSYDLGTNCDGKKFEPVKPDVIIKTRLISKINEEDYVVNMIIESIK